MLLLGLGLGKGFRIGLVTLGLVLGLGVGLGVGVGLDTYKTIFMKVAPAPVALWISVWTFDPVDAGTISAQGKFCFFFIYYIIEEHPQIIVTVTLKISELK